MSKIKSLLFLSFVLFLWTSTNAQTQYQTKSRYSDTTFYKMDTILNDVLIDGEKFSIKVLRDRVDERLKNFSENGEPSFNESPLTFIISKSSNGSPVYVKKFDHEPNDYPYFNYSFDKGQNQSLDKSGKLFLTLNKSYGGSGSMSSWYFINYINGQINLNYLFKASGELAYVAYNKEDNSILLLEGIWGRGESHFAEHRYTIKKYTFLDGTFQEANMGKTKFKYASLDDDKTVQQILVDIKKKEPLILKSIKVGDY